MEKKKKKKLPYHIFFSILHFAGSRNPNACQTAPFHVDWTAGLGLKKKYQYNWKDREEKETKRRTF